MTHEYAIRINDNDNVAVALKDIESAADIFGVKITELIPKGHKFALCEIKPNERVIKYGSPIGIASAHIPPGAHVHSHNLKTALSGLLEYTYTPGLTESNQPKNVTFNGYLRKNGEAGIRNEIWIINTVGCVNKVAENIAAIASRKYEDRKIDGVFTFVHPFGCSQLGDDHVNTQKILKGLVNNSNAAGVLVFGLGCENNTIDSFKGVLGDYDPERVKFLNAQDHEDEVETALEIIDELVNYAETFSRQPVPISQLTIGLKCGGSDGFSGITANPLVGMISDTLAAHGGTTILTEVPEMFGAETILMNRCENEQLFNETVALINGFKTYYMEHNQEIYENPSPGNKEGGITTLEEKSLGCTQKGGTSNVTGVLKYGERPVCKGLNLLDSPGNDIVAITALAASGAHMILFTTGRGTPLGAPVPTIKISSNSDLAIRKPNWTDFNAGTILEGKSFDEACREFWEYIIAVAEGRQTRNEENNYREISIFKTGVTL